jgi:hypothetical protein
MKPLALLATVASVAFVAMGALALAAGTTACGSPPANRLTTTPTDLAKSMHAYTVDTAVGRHALESSIVNHDNAYSALRLARYDERHWGALTEFDPLTAPMLAGGDGAPTAAPALGDPSWAALAPDAVGWSLEELTALGERAFFRYPLQASGTMLAAMSAGDRAGVWEHDGRLGAVWVSLPRGLVRPAFTCATCHASKVGDRLVPGRNNADLDAAHLYDNGSVNVLTGDESGGDLRIVPGFGAAVVST